ncbi:hypothetical protein F5876DRAFT_83090 [Lentinula aff. lateritia]|uniref:Uncharacterized protein n=1 Tax=Lentinula aff. lateritia TaxID=2804960 RepID=A0ACC1TIV8_9AGAR|nr:hypothetical protein F5876DRAFT_83090 [Lentinula aff. lateritia]
MANDRNHKRGNKGGTGTRKQRNSRANLHSQLDMPHSSGPAPVPPPSQKARPQPIPVYKGTPAYEQMQVLHSKTPCETDIAAAEQLMAFQNQTLSQTAQHACRSKPPTAGQLPLTLDEQVFAGAMGLSKADMLQQREFERQYGLEDMSSEPEEDKDTSQRVSTQRTKQRKRFKSISPAEDNPCSMDLEDFEGVGHTFNDDHDGVSSDTEDELQKAWNELVGSVDKFDIIFEVPYKSSQRNLTGITSYTVFTAFIEELAKKMNTRLLLLSNISYLPSYKPKSRTTDVMLEGEEDWIMLIKDAWDHVQNTRGRKPKVWTIRIFDKSPTETGKAKENDDGVKSRKKSSATGPSEQLPASHSDAGILVAIQGKNHCNATSLLMGKVKDNKERLELDLRNTDRRNGGPRQGLDTRLGEKLGHQKCRNAPTLPPPPSVPSVPPQTPLAPAPATDAIAQAMTMVGTVTPLLAMLMNGNRGSREYSPPCTSSSKHHHADSSPAPASSPYKASPSRNEELLIWLPKVDADVEHGKRNARYVQYGGILTEKGTFDLDDLVRLTSERLKAFTGMAYGFCDRLLRYTREDMGIKLPKKARIGQ